MRSSLARIALVALVVVPLAAQVGARAAGPNLAPNPGFEQSPTDPSGDTTHQPMLPTGWAFEGAAGLFDHSENGHHGGKRMAAISAPASTTREICQQGTCEDSPLNVVKDGAETYYSVMPAWRTVSAVPVSGGTTYAFSTWYSLSLATVGAGGAVTKVRWVDANGVPISVSDGPSHIQQPGDAVETVWTLMSRNVTSPANARGAILLLGAADDLFISQTKYDDVSFHTL